MRKLTVGGALVAALWWGSLSPIRGSVITFFGEDTFGGSRPPAIPNSLAARNTFLGLFDTWGVEDFESTPLGTNVSSVSLNFGFTTGIINVLVGYLNVLDMEQRGRHEVSGSRFLEHLVPAGAAPIAIEVLFARPITGFGFFGTDAGDWGEQLSVVVNGARYLIPHVTETRDGNAAVFFFGIYSSDPFDRVVIENISPYSYPAFGYDDFIAAVPEPGTVGLLALGLGIVVWLRRTRPLL